MLKKKLMIPNRHCSLIRAVTLVEVLVSVAILIILIALVFPAFKSVQAHAQAVGCSQKMHQLGTSLLLWTQDNNGVVKAQDLDYNRSPADQNWKSSLYNEGYVKDMNLFFCPTQTTPANGIPINSIYLGYGLHDVDDIGTKYPEIVGGSWGRNQHGLNEGTRTFRINTLEAPSRFILLGDSVFVRAGSYFKHQASTLYMNTYEGQSSMGIHLRHLGKANFFFADGHMEAAGPNKLKEYGAVSGYDEDYKYVPF